MKDAGTSNVSERASDKGRLLNGFLFKRCVEFQFLIANENKGGGRSVPYVIRESYEAIIIKK